MRTSIDRPVNPKHCPRCKSSNTVVDFGRSGNLKKKGNSFNRSVPGSIIIRCEDCRLGTYVHDFYPMGMETEEDAWKVQALLNEHWKERATETCKFRGLDCGADVSKEMGY